MGEGWWRLVAAYRYLVAKTVLTVSLPLVVYNVSGQ